MNINIDTHNIRTRKTEKRLYLVFMGFHGFYWVLLGFTGYYQVLLDLTEFERTLLGCT